MGDRSGYRVRDASLRAAGAVLLLVCCLTMAWLFGRAGHRPPAGTSGLHYLAAMLGVVCFSTGAVLLALGRHVFDEVEVSQRWTRRSVRCAAPRRPVAAPTGREVGGGRVMPRVADLRPAWVRPSTQVDPLGVDA